ncbi:MAG: TolC family protein [Bacteroidaceae bacterium]|nr:TolC family protein [Bacteroidaceae bacterium]
MMRNTISLITLLLLSTSVSAITLQECRQKARENYPLIRNFELLKQTEQYTLSAASKAWLPQVTVGAVATWQNHVAEYPEVLSQMITSRGIEMKGMRKDQYKASVDVQQIVWDGGRISAKKKSTRMQTEEERLSNEVDLYALEERVDELFFSIVLLQKQREALETSRNYIEASLELVRSMLRNGVAMQCDVDALEAEKVTVDQQLLNVSSAEGSFKKVLSLYINVKECPHLELADEYEEGGNSGFRPELSLFEAKRNSLSAQENEIKRGLMPTISAFGTAFYGYPGLNYMDAMMRHDWSFNMQVGLRLSWNISSLYTRKALLNKVKTGKQKVDVMRDVFLFNNRLQASTQQDEINRLKEIAASDNEIVRLRGRVRAAEESKLREGIINTTQLLDKITAEKNALITANTHKIELIKAQTKLRHTLGH